MFAVKVFEETMSLCETNSTLKDAIAYSIKNQRIIWEGDKIDCGVERFGDAAEVVVSNKRSMEAAMKYARSGKKVCVLNFASTYTPGGGVLRGCISQEESICRMSTLYPALSDKKTAGPFYESHHTKIRNGTMSRANNDDCIFTPGVIGLREDTSEYELLPEDQWYTVDIISCAAPDQRDRSFRPSYGDLLKVFERRIEAIVRIAALDECDVLILGAFGCGVFLNPPELVVLAFQNVLENYIYHFETVEFPVGGNNINYRAFSELSDYFSKNKFTFRLPRKYESVDIGKINKTLLFIATEGKKVVQEHDPHQKLLDERAPLFGGGPDGAMAYKLYKYVMKYISYSDDVMRMRYRYSAASVLFIGNFDRNKEVKTDKDLMDLYGVLLKAFLEHKPVASPSFLLKGELTEDLVKVIYHTYSDLNTQEALTLIKVMKALEWDDVLVEHLKHLMKKNEFF